MLSISVENCQNHLLYTWIMDSPGFELHSTSTSLSNLYLSSCLRFLCRVKLPRFWLQFLTKFNGFKKPLHHKDDNRVANAVYFYSFIRSFIVTKDKNSVMVAPSWSASMEDLSTTAGWWLCLIFALMTMLYLSSMAVFHTIVWISKPKVSYFTTLATGLEAQFFAQCTAITTCHEFVMSSFALGKLHTSNADNKMIIVFSFILCSQRSKPFFDDLGD